MTTNFWKITWWARTFFRLCLCFFTPEIMAYFTPLHKDISHF